MPPVEISFRQLDQEIDALHRWLIDAGAEALYEPFKAHGVTDLVKLKGFAVAELEQLLKGKELPDSFKRVLTDFQASFDLERYESFPRAKKMEVEVHGHGTAVNDGLR